MNLLVILWIANTLLSLWNAYKFYNEANEDAAWAWCAAAIACFYVVAFKIGL